MGAKQALSTRCWEQDASSCPLFESWLFAEISDVSFLGLAGVPATANQKV